MGTPASSLKALGLLLRLAPFKEGLEIFKLHPPGAFKLTAFLGIKKLTVAVEHGQGGNSHFQRHVIFLREIEVLVESSHIDVHYNVIGLDEPREFRLLHLRVKDVAV